MEIYCWKGTPDLPSVDISCLHVLAHMKFSETPVSIKTSRTPLITTRVVPFPLLKTDDGEFISGDFRIIKHLESVGFQPDVGLTPQQYADVVTFKAMVMDKLHPYIAYYLWLDDRNFSEFSKPTYAKSCIFPLNFIIPGRLYQSALEYVHGTKIHADKAVDEIADELHLEATDCINLLSSFLGDKEFFFGNRPSSFDALLFAYLAPLIKVKLANTKLQNHVKACENLVKFVSRILTRYFPDEIKSPLNVKADADNKKQHEAEHEWIMPVMIASMVMLIYATHIGLLATSKT